VWPECGRRCKPRDESNDCGCGARPARADSFFIRHVEIAGDRQLGAYWRKPGAAQSLVQSRQLALKLIPRLEQWQGFFPRRLTGIELGGGRCRICPYDFLVESLNVTLNLTQGEMKSDNLLS